MHSVRKDSFWQRWGLWVVMVGSLCAVKAEVFQLESAGARVGLSPSPGAAHHFHQAEGFVNWNLPWRWDLGADWWLQTRLDASAGWLGSSFEDGFIGTLGPSLLFRRNHLPFSLSVGISPTFLSQYEFVNRDFGQTVQFTSHIGFNYDFFEHFRAGYRFQHMSNADLTPSNPGLNLHMFALSYLF